MSSNIQIPDGDLHVHQVRARMPFRYGIATMTEMPHLFLRLAVKVDGREVTGISADHLPPKWFTKVPDKQPDVEIEEMLDVIRHALGLARGAEGASVFAIWQQLYADQSGWATAEHYPPLLAHFGTSLVERALIDAACRAADRPFWQMLRDGGLGLDLGAIHTPLAGVTPGDLLHPAPLPSIIARHTVGLGDPITDGEISDDERVDDGLPQSLAACIDHYGLTHFKIKVRAEPADDLARLLRISDVIHARAGDAFAHSLDGNETFKSADLFREFWEACGREGRLGPFMDRLLFVEQPIHRDMALHESIVQSLGGWADRPPIIIDESDATTESLPLALRLGYAGTSHKNCKGVFKGVANRCLLLKLDRDGGGPFVSSGEDLCNVGPVALPQDLAVMAALGIESVERNGHHYFAGLSMFPDAIGQQVLDAHGDLYHAGDAGWPTLTIEAGRISLASVNDAPFGIAPVIDVEQFEEV